MPVYDDGLPMQDLWLKFLELQTGRSLMLSDSNLSKQPFSMLLFNARLTNSEAKRRRMFLSTSSSYYK